MLTLPHCNIVFQDDILGPIDDGALVVVTGESPNATVRVSIPKRESRKYVTVDRLTGCSFTRKGDTWTFTGNSAYLAEHIGTPDVKMSIMVTPEPGCEDCKQ